ncbi:Lrp/AsnC family transcriptional regulator [Streptomyces avicenniae]|uniref:Lrp/AsnC family transcriptional regulator n=1 Tax=Streptomyces avicenniae TaxID=500153 RepID=UPI001CBA5E97|nr:AsnC family transcriptional regulator [Streptomyces avicenniae]
MEYDDIDRQVVHALQIDGRAPFSRIARVLGVSDQTVARRYTRLRTAGLVHVVGLWRVGARGDTGWVVRLRCVPGAAEELGRMLARRPDTIWVHALSGGTEVNFGARIPAEAPDGRHAPTLLEQLPRTRQVTGVTVLSTLHTFFGGPMSLVNKSGALSAAQAAALRDRPAPTARCGDGPVPADEGDLRLVATLAEDGRAPLADLAAATGWSQSTVRRRLGELRADGSVYLDVEYDRRMFGLRAHMLMLLAVPPSRLEETGRALAGHPEVAYAVATTGPTNLFVSLLCSDSAAVYRYLTTRVAALKGVERVETLPLVRTFKGITPHGGGPATRA